MSAPTKINTGNNRPVNRTDVLKADDPAVEREQLNRILKNIASRLDGVEAVAGGSGGSGDYYLEVDASQLNYDSTGDNTYYLAVAPGGIGTTELAASAVTTAKIADDAVTFAKMQNIATDRLLGRDTAASGSPEEITLDSTLVWSGSQSIGLNLANANTWTNYLAFSEISEPSAAASNTVRLYAVDRNGLTELEFIDSTGFVHDVGEELNKRVRNTTGSTITKGQVVYISGSTGGTPTVALARANSLSTLPATGVALEDIPNNGFGRVMLDGKLKNIDTSAYTEGTRLWVSDSAAGAFTSTEPSYPNYSQGIAVVLTSGVGNGSLQIETGGVFTKEGAAGREVVSGATAADIRTTLGLGTAATVNTGTSGGTVPLLNGTNIYSAVQLATSRWSVGDGLGGVSAAFQNISNTSRSAWIDVDPSNVGANTTFSIRIDGTAVCTWTPTGINSTAIGATTPSTGAFTTLNATSNITTNGSSAGIGYATGAGGTVTQATDKSTGVTLNRPSGTITMNGAALAADTIVSFTLTNSTIAATDVLILNHSSVGTLGAYTLNATCAAGSAQINVRNNTAGSLSEAIVIRFALIKGVTS